MYKRLPETWADWNINKLLLLHLVGLLHYLYQWCTVKQISNYSASLHCLPICLHLKEGHEFLENSIFWKLFGVLLEVTNQLLWKPRPFIRAFSCDIVRNYKICRIFMKFGSGLVYKQKLEFHENSFNGSHVLVRGFQISWAIWVKFVTTIST